MKTISSNAGRPLPDWAHAAALGLAAPTVIATTTSIAAGFAAAAAASPVAPSPATASAAESHIA